MSENEARADSAGVSWYADSVTEATERESGELWGVYNTRSGECVQIGAESECKERAAALCLSDPEEAPRR